MSNMEDKSKKSMTLSFGKFPISFSNPAGFDGKKKGGNEKELEACTKNLVTPSPMFQSKVMFQISKKDEEKESKEAEEKDDSNQLKKVPDVLEGTNLFRDASLHDSGVSDNSASKAERTTFTFNTARSPADFLAKLSRDTCSAVAATAKENEQQKELSTTTTAKNKHADGDTSDADKESNRVLSVKRKRESIDEEDNVGDNKPIPLSLSRAWLNKRSRLCSDSSTSISDCDRAHDSSERSANAVEVDPESIEENKKNKESGEKIFSWMNIVTGDFDFGIKNIKQGATKNKASFNDSKCPKSKTWGSTKSSESLFASSEKPRNRGKMDNAVKQSSSMWIQSKRASDSSASFRGVHQGRDSNKKSLQTRGWILSKQAVATSGQRKLDDADLGWGLREVCKADPSSTEKTNTNDRTKEASSQGLLHGLLQKQKKHRQENAAAGSTSSEATKNDAGAGVVLPTEDKAFKEVRRQARMERMIHRRTRQLHRAAFRKEREEKKKMELKLRRLAMLKKHGMPDKASSSAAKVVDVSEPIFDDIATAESNTNDTESRTVEDRCGSKKRKYLCLLKDSETYTPSKHVCLKGKLKHWTKKYAHLAEKIVPVLPSDAASTSNHGADASKTRSESKSKNDSENDLYHELLQDTVEREVRQQQDAKSPIVIDCESSFDEDKKASPSNSVIDLTALSAKSTFEEFTAFNEERLTICNKMPSDIFTVQESFFGSKKPAEKQNTTCHSTAACEVSTTNDHDQPTVGVVDRSFAEKQSVSELSQEEPTQVACSDFGMKKLENLVSVANDILSAKESDVAPVAQASLLEIPIAESVDNKSPVLETSPETHSPQSLETPKQLSTVVSEICNNGVADARRILEQAEASNTEEVSGATPKKDEVSSYVKTLAISSVSDDEPSQENEEPLEQFTPSDNLSIVVYEPNNSIVELRTTSSCSALICCFFASGGRILFQMLGQVCFIFIWLVCLAHVVGRQLECQEETLSSKSCGWQSCQVSLVELVPFPIMLYWIISEYRLAKSERDLGGVALRLFQGVLCLTAVSISVKLLANTSVANDAASPGHCIYMLQETLA